MSGAPESENKDRAGDDAKTPRTQARGPGVIADYVRRLPGKPGVYRMLSETGDVLYVGKAHNLKKRVSSYTKYAGHSNRISRMIHETASMEFVVTATETEALLLEANLIKRYRPRYNVLLRDDKSFPYILVRRDHEAPQILKHRGSRKKQGDYYGPFASAGAVNRTLDILQKAFLLRTCSDSVYDSRSRPCMLHQIKRCSGPCTGEISEADYNKLVEQANDFLSGKSVELVAELQKKMAAAAEDMNYEQAAQYRDRIRALSAVTETQGINPQGIEEADVIALAMEGGQSCVQVFFFRAGQNWGTRSYFPRHDNDAEAGEVLGAFLAQFYDDKPAPRLVLVNHDFEERELLGEALTVRSERKVEIRPARRGEKASVLGQAENNAREALVRKMAETSTQEKLLRGVAEAFDLDAPPKRIEVYDNSHIMGTNALGAMIVAGPEGFEKSQYRKFNIKWDETEPGDDYAMMQEVLTRRFSRLMKDEEKGSGNRPDLVLIDGGRGQLSSVTEVMDELGLADIPLVAIAKGPDRDAGRETFFMRGRPTMKLEPGSPVLYYLQRLRDESHRFVIGGHRARRKSAASQNPLDEIPGVGASRKKALLAQFGSARGVSRAALADLEKTPGVSTALARKIYDWFRE
ncbi:excinuclease ABC subunit UvrC [Euryhalocaulis caribicus]|uniref:excinuclease ABC subunit UvrC n=1 Tax=Euryhalocaulis caribicus TaxID=1161401 RepID=UPI00039C938C|nr:excinuclease ABC subunit UvrC [Euryhalocaulis caribicus]